MALSTEYKEILPILQGKLRLLRIPPTSWFLELISHCLDYI